MKLKLTRMGHFDQSICVGDIVQAAKNLVTDYCIYTQGHRFTVDNVRFNMGGPSYTLIDDDGIFIIVGATDILPVDITTDWIKIDPDRPNICVGNKVISTDYLVSSDGSVMFKSGVQFTVIEIIKSTYKLKHIGGLEVLCSADSIFKILQ